MHHKVIVYPRSAQRAPETALEQWLAIIFILLQESASQISEPQLRGLFFVHLDVNCLFSHPPCGHTKVALECERKQYFQLLVADCVGGSAVFPLALVTVFFGPCPANNLK